MISDFNMGKNFNNGAYPKHGWSPYFAMGIENNFLGKEVRCSSQ